MCFSRSNSRGNVKRSKDSIQGIIMAAEDEILINYVVGMEV